MEAQNNILNTNPSRFIVAGLAVITFFFGGLTIWSVFFPFQGAVIAPGTVIVSGERKIVQHLEGGIIDKILVKDGDRVSEGDVLIELKSTHITANVDLLQGRLWAKEAEAARLKSEAAMKDRIIWPEEYAHFTENKVIAKIKNSETAIFTTNRVDLQGKKELYNSQIMQLQNRIDGSKQELKSLIEIINNLEEDLQSKLPLVQEKYLGKTSVLELQRSLSEHKGRKGKLIQDIAQFHQMIEELKLRIMDLETQYKDEALSQLKGVNDDIYEVKEQIKPLLDARERLEIRAPTSGIVINMRVHSETSGVVQPASPLMEIVPENSSMIIKAEVRPQDITSVQTGQTTKVQLAAFQRKSTPPINGHVVYVSPDLLYRDNANGTMSYYEVHVVVDETDLKAKDAYLSPGMPVSCYITTDKRSVISYLLNPLLQNIDRAMRE
jgi:epimerase transport system membrane fusion protein